MNKNFDLPPVTQEEERVAREITALIQLSALVKERIAKLQSHQFYMRNREADNALQVKNETSIRN